MAEQGGKFEVAVQVDGYTTTKAFVAAGLGYTVLPLSSVRREVERKQLSAIHLRKPKLSWTLSLAYRKDQRNARAVMALRNIIASEVTAMAAQQKAVH
jgi:LysR family nitrogen assimilation transcriptional regulator